MNGTEYNLQFNKLFKNLNLGDIISTPKVLSGGHLHRMFLVETAQGRYAVKALNPQIMLRPAANQNLINSENIAGIAAKTINVITAKKYNGTFIQKEDGQYYLIYDFADGRCITANETDVNHCVKIGEVLAGIHSADFSSLGLADDYSSTETAVDWDFYLQKGQKTNAAWTGLIRENIQNLYDWNARLILAAKQLSENTVLSHGDLEPKNVLWKNGYPIIIDWEAAGYVHPAFDMIETAIYWSKESDGSVNKNKFNAFIGAYKKKTAFPAVDWTFVFDKGFVMLGWLEYSLKRSLMLECTDQAEQKMGTEHVFGTINNLLNYDKMIPTLAQWLKKHANYITKSEAEVSK